MVRTGNPRSRLRFLQRNPDLPTSFEHEVGSGPPSGALWESFIASKSPTTRRAYSRDVADFAERAGFSSISEAIRALLGADPGQANRLALAYRSDLERAGLAPATINRRLSALRAVVEYANLVGLVPWQLRVSRVRSRPYRDTSGPGKRGVQCLLVQAAQQMDTRKSARDVALIWLLFDPPLRAAEVTGIDMQDLDLPRRRVGIVGKGHREREWVTIPMQTLAAVTTWIEHRGGQPGPLFFRLDRKSEGRALTTRGLQKIVGKIGARCGLRVHPHALRHSGITMALDLGLPARSVQRFARHADLSTLRFYDDNRSDLGGVVATAVADAIAPETPRKPP